MTPSFLPPSLAETLPLSSHTVQFPPHLSHPAAQIDSHQQTDHLTSAAGAVHCHQWPAMLISQPFVFLGQAQIHQLAVCNHDRTGASDSGLTDTLPKLGLILDV